MPRMVLFIRTDKSLISAFFFFFNDTATTEFYPLPLHDALPISTALFRKLFRRSMKICSLSLGKNLEHDPLAARSCEAAKRDTPLAHYPSVRVRPRRRSRREDRKSTRLNSSHSQISYAVFCLKKK